MRDVEAALEEAITQWRVGRHGRVVANSKEGAATCRSIRPRGELRTQNRKSSKL